MSTGETIFLAIAIVGSSGLWLGLPYAIYKSITDPDGKKEKADRIAKELRREEVENRKREQYEAANKPPEGESWEEYHQLCEERRKENSRLEANKKHWRKLSLVVTHVKISDGKIEGIHPSTAWQSHGVPRRELFFAAEMLNENGVTIEELISELPKLEVIACENAGAEDIGILGKSSVLFSLENPCIDDDSNIGTHLESTNSLPNLVGLTITNRSISDLGFLQGAKILERLELPNNDIDDISPLSSLNTLRILNLSGNYISDIGPLASLNELTRLDLSNNEIEYLGDTLDGITYLEELQLQGNDLSSDFASVPFSVEKLTIDDEYYYSFTSDEDNWCGCEAWEECEECEEIY